MSIDKTARALMAALKQKEPPKPFDTTATVTRVEGDIAWVHIPGGVDETPVKMTINASEGDEVQVRVSGGNAWLTGNASAPPTDDTTAEAAKILADSVDGFVKVHLSMQDDGLYVLPEGVGYKVRISNRGVYIVDPGGNDVAQYSVEAIIGQETETHVEIDYHSLKLIDKDGNEYLHVSDLRDQSGVATVEDRFVGDGSTDYFFLTFPFNKGSSGATMSVTVDGVDLVRGTDFEGNITYIQFTSAPADGADIDVTYTTETSDAIAFSFGSRSGTVGGASSASGINIEASGLCAHGEGKNVIARGNYSHAEGVYSTASGIVSHAEGDHTTARGAYSHAQNYGTIADGPYQTVIGTCNIASSNHAFILGNGSSVSNRSNALTIDWNGNAVLAGGLTLKGNVDILSALFYSIGDTFAMASYAPLAGNVTAASKAIYINVPVDKLLDNISSISVTSLKGGIRDVNGNYVNGVTDGNEWVGLSGITITAEKASARMVRVTITSTSAFTSGGATLTNNTPLVLNGTVSLAFS